jgi:hypothetical protein
MPDLGRLLIIVGSLLVLAGLLVIGLGRLHIPLGRLPGDISLRGRNWSFSFPIFTCILLSALLSLVLWLVNRFRP